MTKSLHMYQPMTESAFCILFCLQQQMHGYDIGKKVLELTNNRLNIGPGTMYGTLSKMQKDALIELVKEEDKRKIYQITQLGKGILETEINRIKQLYQITQGGL